MIDSLRNNILKYALCFTVFILPLVCFNNYFFPYTSPKIVFIYGTIAILFPLWIYSIFVDKSYKINKKQLLFFIPPFLYIIWMTISGVLAVNPHLSFWSTFERGTGLITLYSSLLFSLIITSAVNKYGSKYLYQILKYLLLGSFFSIISVWFGNEGFNLPDDFFQHSQGGGFIGNSSVAAPYFIFAFFSGLFLLFRKDISKTWKIFVSITMAMIIFSPLFLNILGLSKWGNILGSARGALVGIFFGLGMIVLGYLALSKKKFIKIIGIVCIFISLIIFSLSWMSFMKPGTYLHNKFIEVVSDSRFVFWNISQESINKHPYLGYGPENFMIAFQENFNPKILNTIYGREGYNDKAHNIYFDTTVSGGYPAVFFYAIFIVSIFYFIYRAYREGRISRAQASTLWGLLVAYVFQNLFVFDSIISIFYLFVLLGLICGSFSGALEEPIVKGKKQKKSSTDVSNIPLGVVLTALSIFLLFQFSVLPAHKSKLFNSVISLNLAHDKSSIYKDLLDGSTMGIDKDAGVLADSIYKIYAKNLASFKNNKEAIPYLEKELKNFIGYLEEVEKSNQTDYRRSINTAHLYSVYFSLTDKIPSMDESNHILDILRHASTLSPNNPQVYWRMAQIYAWQGDAKGVEDSYKKAIEIEPTIPDSHKLLIKFAKNIGNEKLYKESLLQAEQNIPNFNLN